MSTTFEVFSKDFSDGKIKQMNDTYDHAVQSYRTTPQHVRTAKAKATRNNKILNNLRQEAMYDKGYDMNLIFPLSAEQLTGLLKGDFKFNEYNEFVSA
ncbi:hypothetical protein ACED16_02655 [Enterobacter hormaechei]